MIKQFYDIWFDFNKELMMVEAKNPKDALQKIKKELNKVIDSVIEKGLEKKIDPERGLYYYQFIKGKKNISASPEYPEYDKTEITIYDPLDYSYVHGKKHIDFLSYDIFNYERNLSREENENMKKLVKYCSCDCCDHILPKKDIEDCWENKDNSLKNICTEEGLNYEYLEDMSSICTKCLNDKKYMDEYNRIKEIYEKKI